MILKQKIIYLSLKLVSGDDALKPKKKWGYYHTESWL